MTDNERRTHDLTLLALEFRANNTKSLNLPDDYVELYELLLPKIEKAFPSHAAKSSQSDSHQ